MSNRPCVCQPNRASRLDEGHLSQTQQPGSRARRSLLGGLLLVLCCALSTRPLKSQEVAPDCTAADLDTSYQFANTPPTERLGVNFRNLSQRPCQLRPGPGVMFGDYRHGHNIWTNQRSNICDADGKLRLVTPVILAVGAVAHIVIAWETEPGGSETPFARDEQGKSYANPCEVRYANVGASCQEGGQLNSYVNVDLKHGYDIWADTLLGDVCSTVRVDSYSLGPFASDYQGDDLQKQGPITVKITPSGGVLYSNDTFWLHTEIGDPDGVLTLNNSSCPPLFLRTRALDGTTKFSQLGGSCSVTRAEQGAGRSIRLDIPTPGWGALMEAGERTVEVLALVGSPHAPKVKMVSSNALTVHIVDPATIPRTWGPQTNGLAVSLFLDKDTYAVGEDVPLRMAVENFSAEASIASGELPCFAGITFEVQDSSGQLVQPTGGGGLVCTGHGWTIGYPKGKPVPVLGYTLRRLQALPESSGVYTVTAIWNAASVAAGGEQQAGNFFALARPLVPYAVVRSAPVTFHVVAKPR